MSKVLINEETLTSLGDIVRDAKGESTFPVEVVLSQECEQRAIEIDNILATYWLLPVEQFKNYNEVILNWTAGSSSFADNGSCRVYAASDDGGWFKFVDLKNKVETNQPCSYDLTDAFDELFSLDFAVKDYFYIRKFGTQVNNTINAVINVKYLPSEIVDELTEIGSEMGSEIERLESLAFPEEDFQFLSSGNYVFANNWWYNTVMKFGDKFHGSFISAMNMFKDSTKYTEIPFSIHLGNSAGSGASCSGIFQGCSNLVRPPYIYGRIATMNVMFNECKKLEEIPDDWADGIIWDYQHNNSITSCHSNMFYSCQRLRHIPENLLRNLYMKPSSNNTSNFPYSSTFYGCYSLDEIVGLPAVSPTSTQISSNSFTNTFSYTHQLKRLVFGDVIWGGDSDGKTARWNKQTIDLTYYCGYFQTEYSPTITLGLPADKKIADAETYQALKDDPDSWTIDVNYSRYNHTSAVETINSLPKTNGTNTIKFEGASGSLTDGGAISTLTPEEIAVATAKGWTVSLT